VDDYILPVEPVVDYVTRFSGITAADLNPSESHHAVVNSRTALLKLRYFIDAGCILVGHGLQKDFDTANLFVPPDQVMDTVELWHLPNKRKISLKFLASYLLDAGIQDEVHDSVEDAKTALALYKHYVKVKEQGEEVLQGNSNLFIILILLVGHCRNKVLHPFRFVDTLNKIYAFGTRTNWVIGLDKISGVEGVSRASGGKS
jgi:PAB-dependent poly(A)-specific ribonuclease subunit 2